MARHVFCSVSIRTFPGGLADVLRHTGEAMNAGYVEVYGKRCREALAAVRASLLEDRSCGMGQVADCIHRLWQVDARSSASVRGMSQRLDRSPFLVPQICLLASTRPKRRLPCSIAPWSTSRPSDSAGACSNNPTCVSKRALDDPSSGLAGGSLILCRYAPRILSDLSCSDR